MRKFDEDGRLMCEIQGKIFEKSLDCLDCSSPVFIKNYMLGDVARSMDILAFLNTTISDDRVLYDMRSLSYGSSKYSVDEMYFIGYFYRYVSYVYEIDSKKVFKLISSSTLKKYAYTGLNEGVEKVLYELENYYHICLDNRNDLFVQLESNINELISDYKFKPNLKRSS